MKIVRPLRRKEKSALLLQSNSNISTTSLLPDFALHRRNRGVSQKQIQRLFNVLLCQLRTVKLFNAPLCQLRTVKKDKSQWFRYLSQFFFINSNSSFVAYTPDQQFRTEASNLYDHVVQSFFFGILYPYHSIASIID